jgi:Mn2+/Fe2+ NRAMP family transporter
MCGRIGLVTGKGLSGVMRKHYSRPALYLVVFLLLTANTINIGADLGAMASSAQLIINLPFVFWILLMTVGTLLLEIFVSYRVYARYLKYLTFSLLAYLLVAFLVQQDWSQIFVSTIQPSFSYDKQYLLNIVALLGTTISPYLFFWQADEEVEEEVATHKLASFGRGTPKINRTDIRKMRLDTACGMFFSQLITFFIIITAASTLGRVDLYNIETASQAAAALAPLAGRFTSLLFALGIVGIGLLAVPILAGSASYAIAEAFGWHSGLYRKLRQAHGFYGVITMATLVGLLVNFISIPPFKMLYYTAVLNGIIAPILLLFILLISNNRAIMGEHVNSRLSNVFGLMITTAMTAAAGAVVWSWLA